MNLIETIVEKLHGAEIELQHFHPESAPDQYEFVLGPLGPLEAVDTLIAAREIIASAAAEAGLRATLYPKPVAVSYNPYLFSSLYALQILKWNE